MCPTCNSRKSKTTNTRKYATHIWRRKYCTNCGRSYSTKEVISEEHRERTERINDLVSQNSYLSNRLSVAIAGIQNAEENS